MQEKSSSQFLSPQIGRISRGSCLQYCSDHDNRSSLWVCVARERVEPGPCFCADKRRAKGDKLICWIFPISGLPLVSAMSQPLCLSSLVGFSLNPNGIWTSIKAGKGPWMCDQDLGNSSLAYKASGSNRSCETHAKPEFHVPGEIERHHQQLGSVWRKQSPTLSWNVPTFSSFRVAKALLLLQTKVLGLFSGQTVVRPRKATSEIVENMPPSRWILCMQPKYVKQRWYVVKWTPIWFSVPQVGNCFLEGFQQVVAPLAFYASVYSL